MNKNLRHSIASAFLLLPAAAAIVALPSTALAQPAGPEVRSLEATADGRLEPGTLLTFRLEGTPRAQASVRIRGLRENIALRETERGVYRGGYTIKRGDNIEPDAGVRALLENGNRQASANYELAEILPRPRGPLPPPRVADLRIERFGMAPLERIEPGADLRFMLEGTPGAAVLVDLPGIGNDLGLREVRPGVYEGSYTLRRADNFNPNRPIVATLRMGDRVTTANLSPPPSRPGPETRPPNVDNRPPTLTFLAPPEGTTLPPGPSVHVAATFDDGGGSGVDPASVQLVVAGRNVTRDAQINRQSLSYWGLLPPGHHTVDVTAKDMAGNLMRRSWSFDVASGVVPPPPAGRPPVVMVPGPASLAVQVLNHYDNDVIGPDPVLVKGRTAPNAVVAISVRAVPPPPPAAGLPRTVYAQTLQADAEGNFAFTMVPGTPYPGERYDIQMVSRRANLSQESRFSLLQR
jgi:hypothetical protein